MKNNSRIILSLTLFIASLLNLLNSEPVSEGNTIYYSRNKKCAFYGNNQKFCLVNEKLYNNNEVILSIEEYSEYNYYELNLYKTDNDNRNCILTYFSDKNKLILKYYNINIHDNIVNDQKDFTYYSTTLKPLNKGINCQARDSQYQFICFYFNKEKDVVKMDIKNINNTINVTVDFQVGKINNKDNLYEGNIMIMSSL